MEFLIISKFKYDFEWMYFKDGLPSEQFDSYTYIF